MGRTLRTFSPGVADLRSVTFHSLVHPRLTRYKLREPDAHAPWTSSMTPQLRKLLGTDRIGTTALNMLSSSLAPTTYANYDSGMRQFAAFCHEEDMHPLQATTQSIVRYTTSLGLQGTVAAASQQQYYSVINKFFPRPPPRADCRRQPLSGRTPRTRNAARMATRHGRPPTVTSPLGSQATRRSNPNPQTPNMETTGTTSNR
jgi:hypothetical protein